MLPAVLIDIGPPNVRPSYASALVTACSQAVPRGRCVLSGSEANLRPDAIAIVSWQGTDQQDVEIQVGTRSAGQAHWTSRRMHFSSADAPVERWRAAGLTVATLVGEARPPPPVAVPPPAQPSAARTTSRRPLWIDVAGLTGPGLETGAWRLGALLGADYALRGVPIFVGGSLGYSVRSQDARGISVGFLTLAGEAGAALRSATFPVEVDAAGGLELEQVSAGVEQSGRSDSGSRWVPGLRGRVQALYPVWGSFAVSAGLVGWVQTGPTEVNVHDVPSERVAGAGFCIELGIRARLP